MLAPSVMLLEAPPPSPSSGRLPALVAHGARAPVEPCAPVARAGFGDLVGSSAAMARVHDVLAELARTDVPVLFRGETGTGKELAARALHLSSARAQGPFVALECAALATRGPAEVFGYVAAAFAGAEDDAPGIFEQADGGTLFLDEVGELPRAIQRELLRFFTTHVVRRVGDHEVRPVDVRVTASSQRDLEILVQDGRFLAGLLRRLRGAEVVLPPLRERLEDIPELVMTLAARVRCRLGDVREAHPLGSEELACLERHRWPGNVRELRNWVARELALGASRRALEL